MCAMAVGYLRSAALRAALVDMTEVAGSAALRSPAELDIRAVFAQPLPYYSGCPVVLIDNRETASNKLL